jgi:hypothetical protein
VAVISLDSQLRVGDTIRVVGPNTDVTQQVEQISIAVLGESVAVEITEPVQVLPGLQLRFWE